MTLTWPLASLAQWDPVQIQTMAIGYNHNLRLQWTSCGRVLTLERPGVQPDTTTFVLSAQESS